MRSLVAAAALVAALVAVAPAGAGGWATVGFAPLPDGTSSNATWRPEITVLQHGRTPLEGLTPIVTIRAADTGASRSFTASPTGEAGVYEASVVFPAAGSWRVEIDSGFGDSRVTYGPFAVGAGSPGATSDELPLAPVVAVAVLLAAAAAAALGARRLRRVAAASR